MHSNPVVQNMPIRWKA